MSSDAGAPEKRMITLKSSDNETFEIEGEIAAESEMFKFMMEDDCADNTIPLPNVDSKILAMVLEYCKRHAKSAADKAIEEETKTFDDEFVKVDQGTLFDLMLAASYLNIKGLLDLTCQTVADMMKGKNPEEIRKKLHIKNDFTPGEEADLRRENAWAFE